MGTILVIGATGNQGGALVRNLRARGEAVRALTRNPSSAPARAVAATGAEIAVGDMDDAPSLRAAMDGCSGVFSVQNFWEKKNDEVAQGRRVIDVAAEVGVGHLVFASVARADDHPGLGHFATKWEVERYLHASPLSWTILRPVYFMDNLVHPKHAAPSWRFLQHFVGRSTLQMIACDDIGEFAARALLDPAAYRGRTVDLAGDEISAIDAIDAYTEACGQRPKITPIPGFVLESFRWILPELWRMFDWYREPVFDVDVGALRDQHPGLLDLRSFFAARSNRGAEAR